MTIPDQLNTLITKAGDLLNLFNGSIEQITTHQLAETAKVDAAIDEIGLNQGATDQDPDDIIDQVVFTTHANCPNATSAWHITTSFQGTKSMAANRSQIALEHGATKNIFQTRVCTDGVWSVWKSVVSIERGTYLPEIKRTVTDPTVVYENQFGTYCVLDDEWVTVTVNLRFSVSSSGSGSIYITLPITPSPYSIGGAALGLVNSLNWNLSDANYGYTAVAPTSLYLGRNHTLPTIAAPGNYFTFVITYRK